VIIVFDTNVLLAGLFARGLCEELLDFCLGSDQHTVVASQYIFDEFARAARTRFKAPADEVAAAAVYLRRHIDVVQPTEVPATACRDSDDLPILGTAVAAKVDCLVTGDKDLLSLGEYCGIAIVSPRELYARLAEPGF
jgi:uncharacterized protein